VQVAIRRTSDATPYQTWTFDGTTDDSLLTVNTTPPSYNLTITAENDERVITLQFQAKNNGQVTTSAMKYQEVRKKPIKHFIKLLIAKQE